MFTKFVEVGRVVVINYGENLNKAATIVDIVDGKRVLIDGPQEATGVHRQVISTSRITLTNVVVEGLERNASQKSLKAEWKAQNISEKFAKTSIAQKIAKKAKRAATSDFDRFKVMIAKKQKSQAIAQKL